MQCRKTSDNSINLLAVMRAFYDGDIDREAPQSVSVAAHMGADQAHSNDLLFMLGKVMRPISDALASIEDRQRGSPCSPGWFVQRYSLASELA